MVTSLFQTTFDTNATENELEYYTDTSPDGVVYNHLQLTLQVQNEFNKQTEENSYIPFDEFYNNLQPEQVSFAMEQPTFYPNMYTITDDYSYLDNPYKSHHPLSTIDTFSENLFNNEPFFSEQFVISQLNMYTASY